MSDSGPQPIRVLTVTGRSRARATRPAISTMAAGLRSQAAPAPPRATRGTQQPQLMSTKAGRALAAIRAASSSRSASGP